MGAYLSRLVNHAVTITAAGMQTQIGVQTWARRVSALIASVGWAIFVAIQRQWRRWAYQEFILRGPDAVALLRWVQSQPSAQIASSFSVQKDVAVQLKRDVCEPNWDSKDG